MIFRVGKDKPTDGADNSSFQIAANWQANKNFLVKVSYTSLLLICLQSILVNNGNMCTSSHLDGLVHVLMQEPKYFLKPLQSSWE